ncbi:MAG: hypothetical protein H7A23_24625 [Leptospiraceae bacterium]|nr:hypothetical protein [Leptospiraceae bacterium]MCP5497751.1 hypothetical protein [Leptospiraceae bacterium]
MTHISKNEKNYFIEWKGKWFHKEASKELELLNSLTKLSDKISDLQEKISKLDTRMKNSNITT